MVQRVFMEGEGAQGPGAPVVSQPPAAAPLPPAPEGGRVLPLNAEASIALRPAPAAAPIEAPVDPLADVRAMLTPQAPAAVAPAPFAAPLAFTPENTAALLAAGWRPPAPAVPAPRPAAPVEGEPDAAAEGDALASRLAALEAREAAAADASFHASNRQTVQAFVRQLVPQLAGRLPAAQQTKVLAEVTSRALDAYDLRKMPDSTAMQAVITAEINASLAARMDGAELARGANGAVRTEALAHTPIAPNASSTPVDTFDSLLRARGKTRDTMVMADYNAVTSELRRRAG